MEEITIPKEINIGSGDMIVSSTDLKGNIVYTNDIFCKYAGYTREELIGQPHNILRHEDMPRAIFYLLWSEIQAGRTIYAFVKNKSKNGDFYWVKAYVKPIYENGQVVKYTSYRKPVNPFAKEYITKLYAALVEYEKTHSTEESIAFVLKYLEERKLSYNEFINRLSIGKSVDICHILDKFKYLNAHIIFKAHIFTALKNGEKHIHVPGCHDCEFGKNLDALEGQPFTNTVQWRALVQHHAHVHNDIALYVQKAQAGANASELQTISKNIDEDTKNIFENLTNLVDTYKG
jgi:PAS domain S-box-containing protein